MGRIVKGQIVRGRNVIGTKCGGRIVKDEMSCTEVNGHRISTILLFFFSSTSKQFDTIRSVLTSSFLFSFLSCHLWLQAFSDGTIKHTYKRSFILCVLSRFIRLNASETPIVIASPIVY